MSDVTAPPCTGEQIDTFVSAFPRPSIDRDQYGIVAISVRNKPDPSLNLQACFATDIAVTTSLSPTPLVTGLRLDPNQSWQGVQAIPPSALPATPGYFVITVTVTGLSDGQYHFTGIKTVGLVVR